MKKYSVIDKKTGERKFETKDIKKLIRYCSKNARTTSAEKLFLAPSLQAIEKDILKGFDYGNVTIFGKEA